MDYHADHQAVYQAEESQFAENVQRLREDRGWSQGELARRMVADGWEGFHQTTISRIEKGQRPVRLAEARGLARVLGSQIGIMTAPPPESAILESLASEIGMMRLARKRIYAGFATLEEQRARLQSLIDKVEEIPQEQWERLGIWDAIAQMVVQASHMQKWTPETLVQEMMEHRHGQYPET